MNEEAEQEKGKVAGVEGPGVDVDLLNHQVTSIFDGINEIVYVADPETYDILFVNKLAQDIFGNVVGQTCYQVFQRLDHPCAFCTNKTILGEYKGKSYIWEFQNQVTKKWYRCIDKAIPWTDDRLVRFEMAIDVTDLKRAEDRLTHQAQEILELSTPVVQVWEGILIAPLIGMLDSQRTEQFMERFLDGIVETRSAVALVDITGVPAVDTQTAQHLIEAITAARLLGTRVILTGVRPPIAQTLVHLGVDLAEIETRSSMAAGLRLALGMVGLKIVPQN